MARFYRCDRCQEEIVPQDRDKTRFNGVVDHGVGNSLGEWDTHDYHVEVRAKYKRNNDMIVHLCAECVHTVINDDSLVYLHGCRKATDAYDEAVEQAKKESKGGV